MSPRLQPSELRERFADAIGRGGGEILALEEGKGSFIAQIQDNGDQFDRRVYLRNITHGGASRSEDEYRIQLVNVDRLVVEPAGSTLLLGWSEDERVFAAFDVGRHSGRLGSSPSFQVLLSKLQAARRAHLEAYVRANNEVVLCMQPVLLLGYARDPRAMHALASPSDIAVVREILTAPALLSRKAIDHLENQYAGPRREAVVEITRKVRDAKFRFRVLEAYQNSCAVCGTQLNLVDAAHIVPVSDPTSTDETSNGLALCRQHHAAYDQGLVLIRPDFNIEISEKREQVLQRLGLTGGLDDFRLLTSGQLTLPRNRTDWPNQQYLHYGMERRRRLADGEDLERGSD